LQRVACQRVVLRDVDDRDVLRLRVSRNRLAARAVGKVRHRKLNAEGSLHIGGEAGHERLQVVARAETAFEPSQHVLPDPGEVEEYRWMDTGKLVEDMKTNPDEYAPWFRAGLRIILSA